MDNMTPFECYAMWNDELLKCIMSGRAESTDADVIRSEMDKCWAKMTPTEQDKMRRRNEGRRSDIDLDELLEDLKDES